MKTIGDRIGTFVFIAFLASWGMSHTAFGQGMTISVNAKLSIQPCRLPSSELTWCLDPGASLSQVDQTVHTFPSIDADVQKMAGAVFRQRIIARLRRAEAAHHQWFVPDIAKAPSAPDARNFAFNDLQGEQPPRVAQININVPAPPGPPVELTEKHIEVEVTLESDDVVPLATIHFRLISADSPDPTQAELYSLDKIRTEFGLPAHNPDDAKVSVEIQISDGDAASCGSREAALKTARRLVADSSEILWRHTDLRLGAGASMLDDVTSFPSLSGELMRWLRSPRGFDIGSVLDAFDISISHDDQPDNTSVAIIEFNNVHYIRSVKIQGNSGANADALIALQEKYVPEFEHHLRGQIPRGQAMGRAVYALAQDEYVAVIPNESPLPAFHDAQRTLVFNVSTRDVVKKISLTAGGGYSAEKGLAATGVFAAENLISHSENWKLAFDGGNHIFDTMVGISVPPTAQPFDAGTHFLGTNVSGGYSFNNKKHFGVTSTTEQLSSISGDLSYGFDSLNLTDHLFMFDGTAPTRKRAWNLLVFKPAFDISFINADAAIASPAQQQGQISYVEMSATYDFSYDLQTYDSANGFHDVTFEVTSSAGRAGSALGGDFRYDMLQTQGMLESHFGLLDTQEFFLRGIAGAATVGSGAPLQRQLQPGGNYVRGLERGEILEHSLLFQQFTAGMSFAGIWHRLHRAAANSASSDNKAATLPFDINQSYATVFFDHGWGGPSTSFARTLETGQSLDGFGIAAELDRLQGKLDLTIGYGYSRQSLLHHKGLFFTSAKIRL